MLADAVIAERTKGGRSAALRRSLPMPGGARAHQVESFRTRPFEST
jgi:hypothetical protein